jgi:tetratricopeptide (TPR) repeat protein
VDIGLWTAAFLCYTFAAMADDMYKQAVEAAKAGQRNRAKDLFTRLIRADAKNVDYWLWMSAVVDSEKEQVFCLQNALKIDPNSIQARRGLVVLGAMKPEDAALPPAQQLEELDVEIPEVTAGGMGGFLGRRRNQEVLLIGGLATLAVGIVVVLFITVFAPNLFRGRRVVVVTSTATAAVTPPTALPGQATYTPAPCSLPYDPDPAQPLSAYLCLTPQPTVVPIATGASVYQDFQRMQKAYAAADWNTVLSREEQVLKIKELEGSPLPYFYLGEAYRHTEQLSKALSFYGQALGKDRNYAPAYWGRALTKLDPKQNDLSGGLDDLAKAIAADPAFAPAMRDRGQYYYENSNLPRALQDFEGARLAAPNNAEVLAYLALAYAESGQPQPALEAAQQALNNDAGLALGYFARGRAEYALGQFEAADKDLTLSYRYVVALDDVLYRSLWQARTLYAVGLGKVGIGNDSAALNLFTQSIAAYDSNNPLTHIARGDVYMRQKNYNAARDDYNSAIRQFEANDTENPAKLEAYLGNGRAFLALDRPDSAITSFLLVVRRRPDDFEANLGYGTAIVLIGEGDNGTFRDALNSLNSAVAHAQTDEQQGRALYWRSRLFKRLGRAPEEAADLNALLVLPDAPADLVPTAISRLGDLGSQPTLTPAAGGATSILPAVTDTPTAVTPAAGSATAGASGTPAAPSGTPAAKGTPAATPSPSAT